MSFRIKQINEQLERKIRTLPTLIINKRRENIWDYEFSDFELKNYNPHPPIKGKVAV